ncbi:MAG: thioredoxin family protein [Chitinophagaceae bacterium]
MKRILFFSFLGIFAGKLLAQKNIQSLPIGTKAPLTEQTMKDVSSKMVSIKDAMMANGVLVMFSCNTCPYVIKNQDRTKSIANYAIQNKLGVIILNSNEAQRNADDSFEAMKNYAKAQGYNYYYVVDENAAVANAFGATRTPEIFLLNKEGTIIYKGAIDDNPADATQVKSIFLKEAIDELVSGKPITVKESKSIGCTIKRKV